VSVGLEVRLGVGVDVEVKVAVDKKDIPPAGKLQAERRITDKKTIQRKSLFRKNRL
jgi:hypothetical protein